MDLVKFKQISDQVEYDELAVKDPDTVYFIAGSGHIYVGDKLHGGVDGLTFSVMGSGSFFTIEEGGDLYYAGATVDDALSDKKFGINLPTTAAVFDMLVRTAALWDQFPTSYFNSLIIEKPDLTAKADAILQSKREWTDCSSYFEPAPNAYTVQEETFACTDGKEVEFSILVHGRAGAIEDTTGNFGYNALIATFDGGKLKPSSDQFFLANFWLEKDGEKKMLGPGVVKFNSYGIQNYTIINLGPDYEYRELYISCCGRYFI
jgi:hypothetical protein